MRKLIILLILFFNYSFIDAQENQLELKIIKMMDAMGANQQFEVIMDNMIDLEKEQFKTSISDEFWELFRTGIKTKGQNELYKLLIPIYKKHLSKDDIIGIIEFYKSDSGQSLLAKTPIIFEDSYAAGQEWGKLLVSEISKEIENSQELKFHTKLTNCDSFKQGKFKYYLPDSTLVEVVRKDSIQTETYNGNVLNLKINWIDKCRYKVWEISGKDEILGDKPIIVNIFEINNHKYKFITKLEDDDFYSIGEIEKISD
tara:strand:- start:1749 stop:2519 length:771 start_codon:yes stop_codon:yes gene_type:complete